MRRSPPTRLPIPEGFDWTLWLGPSLDRPYHPTIRTRTFRGWYEFGGGSIADMGHYSLWPVFVMLDLDSPISVESTPSHVCSISDEVSRTIKNDYSFPAACTVRSRFAAKGSRPALDIFWYDGGMKPPTPDELVGENKELQEEGMMFVGDKGKIIGGFRGEKSQLIPQAKMEAYQAAKIAADAASQQERVRGEGGRESAWVAAFKGGPPTYGNFLLGRADFGHDEPGRHFAAPGRQAAALGRREHENHQPPRRPKSTSTREYRKGWELNG